MAPPKYRPVCHESALQSVKVLYDAVKYEAKLPPQLYVKIKRVWHHESHVYESAIVGSEKKGSSRESESIHSRPVSAGAYISCIVTPRSLVGGNIGKNSTPTYCT